MEVKKDNLAIVLSPIRTGSTTLTSALRRCGVDSIHITESILPFHFWNKCSNFNNRDFFVSFEKSKQLFVADTNNIITSKFIDHSVNFYEKVTIFTIYREPIERALSTFFFLFANHQKSIHARKDIQHAHNIFNDGFLYGDYVCDFKRDNITEKLFGISNRDYVIEQLMKERGVPFFKRYDTNKKYVSSKKNKREHYIGVRLRDVDSWSDILSDLYGTYIVIEKRNSASKKYGFYKKFIETYHVPSKYIEDVLMYDSMLLNFLTQTEHTEYINKWKNRSC